MRSRMSPLPTLKTALLPPSPPLASTPKAQVLYEARRCWVKTLTVLQGPRVSICASDHPPDEVHSATVHSPNA